ncbi:MAG: 3-isopropylmalate dehydratase small subunit [Anaerolineales bacterium]|nr:3-isopropylmalate dehydratase small subunit [Anaerolineales bacterium]
MEKFHVLTSHVVALPVNDIDTDQIIPARFLKRIQKDGFGQFLFADWRYLADGSLNPDFILNNPQSQGASILLAGDNFGCGSSREHAPWSLADWGFRAVLSTSFADIFYNNSLKVGLLPVQISPENSRYLFETIQASPQTPLTIDLPSQSWTLSEALSGEFTIHPFAKQCLLDGMDQLSYLFSFEDRVTEYEATHGS